MADPAEDAHFAEEEEYEWEYETESEDEVVDREIQNAKSMEKERGENDSSGAVATQSITANSKPVVTDTNGSAANGDDEDGHRRRNGEEGKKKHKKHKKSRHLERLEAFTKKDDTGGESKRKRIHVRSKDPLRIARQIEKNLSNVGDGGGAKAGRKSHHRSAPIAPQPKINTICKICGKEPYVVERIVAEKSWWCKNCFRCKQCNKILNQDTYMSHEGVIYCKPHHKELFQPKVVKADLTDVSTAKAREDIIARHKEQEKKMETIVRESRPVDLGDKVIKSSAPSDESKYQGLENLDVGSKFKMFEQPTVASSDRYGIMEKLRRLQEGEELDELLAEIEEELPSDPEEDHGVGGGEHEGEPPSAVRKKTCRNAEKLFGEGGQERRDKLAAERRLELKQLREKLMAGTREAVIDQFGDILNASANKIKKTKVDVRSENAKKFREMFDKGEVPEGSSLSSSDRTILEKENELEQMRKTKRQQKEFFKRMEAGEDEATAGPKEPKLLVGKITKSENGDLSQEVPELASLSNRFSFFEHFEEKEKERKEQKKKPILLPAAAEGQEDVHDEERSGRHLTEADLARRECKARNVLNKFKEMEARVNSGDGDVKADDPDKPVMTALGFLGRLPGVGERRPLKRFTPPRKLGSESESEYSDSSDYSDSEDYSNSSSYTSSYTSSDSESGEEDETLQAIRNTARAQKLRAKFEEWEKTQDAKDQMRQMMIHDENGASLETASNLKARFEALHMAEGEVAAAEQKPKFRPKRFK